MIYPTQTCTRQMWEPHSPPMLRTPDGTSRARSALSLILLLGTWLSGENYASRFPGRELSTAATVQAPRDLPGRRSLAAATWYLHASLTAVQARKHIQDSPSAVAIQLWVRRYQRRFLYICWHVVITE